MVTGKESISGSSSFTSTPVLVKGTGGAESGGDNSEEGGEMGPVVVVKIGTKVCQGMTNADWEI